MMTKKITQAEANMIARLNAERFTAAELAALAAEIHQIPEHQRDWEGRMIFLARHFPTQADRAMAADHRLVALSALLESNPLLPGVLPIAPDGSLMLPESVFEAAASEPLLHHGNTPYFDMESFARRILDREVGSETPH